MKRFSAKLLCAVSSSALLMCVPVEAQSVKRIVAFGDSYADDGNLFELLGIPRPAVYPNGRFSDATNFVDTMAQILAVPVDNFAIGGAFTGNGNINGPGIPGFVTEYQSFLAGGGPAAFPRVSGRFDPNDLVVVSIGGNDARAYERSLGLTPTSAQIASLLAGVPGQAQTRVTEATTGLNALVNAGARNFTFLVGDVGRLPEVRGLPVAAVGTAYANAFNSGIQTSLANLASQGVIVNYLDLSQIGNVVESNPAAFGLISAGACPVACVTTDTSLLSKYLFYVDQVHLTSAGFAIVGRYAVRQLEAPLHFQAQTDLGLETGRAFGSAMLGRLDLSDARNGTGNGGVSVFVSGTYAGRGYARTDRNLGYDIDVPGVTGGIEYDAGAGAVFGAAANYSRPEADMSTATGRIEAEAVQLGVYGGWAGGGAFAEAYASYGWLNYDISREAVIDQIGGAPDGKTTTAGAKAGFLFGMGAWRVGPVAGLQYGRAELEAYRETGDPVLTLNVEEQDVEALVGSLGVEARGALDAGGLAVRPYVSVTAERDFKGDSRTIRYAGTASPTIVNSFVLPDRAEETYGRVSAGASFELGGTLSLQVNGSASFDQQSGNDRSGFVGLRVGF